MRHLFCIPLAIAAAATPILAQPQAHDGAPADGTAADCAYTHCALSLAPRWSGLALVRGASGQRASELGFFWPGDVRPTFAGSDSALHFATRATSTRRIGAVLTDAGLVLLALGGARAVHEGQMNGTAATLAGSGAILLGASVPAQFAADGLLSRAVWWKNAQYAK
jgi:hypothetical protein